MSWVSYVSVTSPILENASLLEMNKSHARSAGSDDRHFGRFFRGFGDWHANGAELGGKDGFGGVLGHAVVKLLERYCGAERQPAAPNGHRPRAGVVVVSLA